MALHPGAVATVTVASAVAAAPAAFAKPHFTYLFEDLVGVPENLLPNVPTILKDLKDLGMSMRDVEHAASGNSAVPSAYTYFGQFVDHDITFTNVKKPDGVTDAKVLEDLPPSPWPLDRIHNEIENKRGAVLELDCVYGLMPPEKEGAARELPPSSGSEMSLGRVTITNDRPPGMPKDEHDYDLPRLEKSTDKKLDRAPRIADPRNDSNLILSQLHVAFLRAHNELVRRGNSFEEARRILRDCYHWIIVHDFLMKIADQDVVKQVLSSSDRLYPIKDTPSALPLEFTVAAYRFGHSMIRKSYYLSESAQFVSLGRLFMPIVLGQGLGPRLGKGAGTLPENMMIQWESFLPGLDNRNKARQMSTLMVEPLYTLLDEGADPVVGERSLAVQDLKRGYMLGIPTGQAVAKRLGIANPITRQEIEDLARKVNPEQLKVLTRPETKLSSNTPLWYYILAEAKICNIEKDKDVRLGPVGSRLVAEVLIGLIHKIPDSFLHSDWKPSHSGFQDDFTLTDLLRLAKVLPKNF
jgi:hypothetical protein